MDWTKTGVTDVVHRIKDEQTTEGLPRQRFGTLEIQKYQKMARK